MSFEITALIILLGSLVGLAFIILRKLPILADLPETSEESGDGLRQRFSNKIKSFSLETFLQKALSRMRILTLKTEKKTADWLHALRQRTQKQNNFGKDNYWQEIKGASNSKSQEKGLKIPRGGKIGRSDSD
ncbi:MAG: hypothetical protein G01um101430_735 [Parcubacteria group bacterium Gr01-1014_30]|nr:MAG: hypothetical protein G01um101430_735 [Parcubacteria group bacterium Gr01-1014_30]